jgi:hypothetical protein
MKIFNTIITYFRYYFRIFENDLSPIIFDAPFNLKSKTGTVLIFIPIDFNKYEVLSINNL